VGPDTPFDGSRAHGVSREPGHSPRGHAVARERRRLGLRLLELDRQCEIARPSADTYQRTLDLFTQRYEGGKDTKLSTSRAEASLAASVATIARLDEAILKQENAISELVGAPPRPIERGNPLTAQSSPAAPPGLTSDLLQRRPDILRAQHDMMSANAEIGVAVADFFPRIGRSSSSATS
jgi:outer membrane protein, multidrug efflux system